MRVHQAQRDGSLAALEPRPAQRVLPHNLDAEKSALGAVLIDPAVLAVLMAILQVDDFLLPAHRLIFEAMLAVHGRGQPIDVVPVADELKTRGMLQRLDGGESYLLALANATPTAENAAHYAAIVKQKATLRSLIATCAEVQSSAYGDFGEFEAFLEDAEGKIARVVQQGRSAPPALSTLIERLLPRGPRLQTALRTLDAAHRGGFLPGRVVMVAGAPGAGKTSLAIDLAVRWALDGVRVSVLAADEPASGLLIRVGQILGLARDDLEAGAPETLEVLRGKLAELPGLTFVDADDGGTVETAGAGLRDVGRSVLIVDSLQTARAAGSVDADNPRARVDAVIVALKTVARRGVTVVATCELARGAYRSRDASERTEDLAAGKETGSIEYSAATLLVLRSVPDEGGLIDVTVPKNRGGARTPFRLEMNYERATLHEIAIPDDASGGARLDATTQLETDLTAARQALRDHPGVAGIWGLAKHLPGMGKTRQQRAAKALRDAGEVREERGPRNSVRWFLVDSPPLPGIYPDSPPGRVARQSPQSPPTPIGGGDSGGDPRGDRDDGHAAPLSGEGEEVL